MDIINSLSLSHRLRARAGALLARGIGITAALLETAEPRSELEAFLLAPALMKNAELLTEKTFTEILNAYSDDLKDLVVFQKEKGGRGCLMLTDEKIAGEILGPSSESVKHKLAQSSGEKRSAVDQTDREDAARLDDPDSLKMTILTSADTETKVETIRQMLFSEHDTIDKGNLFFAALSDEDSTVRAEALKAMNRIGLDADLADAMLALCSGSSPEIPASVKRLAGILTKVTRGEAVIGAKILVSRLKDNVSTDSIIAIVQTLAGMIEKIRDEKSAVLEISEQVLRVFIREPYRTAVITQTYFRKVLPFKHPEIFAFLFNEVFRIDDVRISSVIVSLLFPFEKDRNRKKKMLEHIMLNIEEVSGSEEGKRMVVSALAVIDSSTVYTLVSHYFGSYSDDVKISILYYLGSALRRGKIPARTFSKLTEIFIDILRTENSKLVIVLLESGMLSHPNISREKKKTVAWELIRLWEVFTIPYLQYALEDTLSNLGAEAAEVMFDFVQQYPESETAVNISPILGDGVQHLSAEKNGYEKKVFSKCVNRGIELFKADIHCKGVLAEMLGKACASSLMTKKKAGQIYELLSGAEDYTEHRAKILEGLGWLGASSNVDFSVKAALAGRFERLLNIKLPDVKGRKFREDDMNVFVLGPEADIYTDFLPAVISGLVRIGTSLKPERELQGRILKAILRMWRKTSSWDAILGPAASSALVEGMRSFGTMDSIGPETKKLILSELCKWKNQLYVLEAIGKMAVKGPEEYEFTDLYAEVLNEILGMLKRENDVYSEKEKMVILGCYSNIISSRRIDPSHEDYMRFVDAGLTSFVRAHKEGITRACGWIEELSKNTDIPAKKRREAKQILTSLSGKSIQIAR